MNRFGTLMREGEPVTRREVFYVLDQADSVPDGRVLNLTGDEVRTVREWVLRLEAAVRTASASGMASAEIEALKEAGL